MATAVVVVVEGDDGQHRAEDLLLGDPRRRVDPGEDGRGEVVAALVAGDGHALAAGGQLGPLLLADAHVALDPLQLLGRDQRAHVGGGVGGRADGDPLGDVDQAGHHLVVDRPGHQQPAAGGADLALVEEDRVGGAVGGQLQVGVVEQDVGRLAAQLQQDLLDRAGGQGGDPPADLGRAGEGDLVDLGRGDQRLAGLGPEPGQDVDHPVGHARPRCTAWPARRPCRGSARPA